MGRLDRFEDQMDRAMDGAAGALFKSTLNPVQIMKRASKEMSREKLVSAGKQYAPTLYNILVNADDDHKLAGFYPTMAGELETALKSEAAQQGYSMDGVPLVRFIVDKGLKRGKFDVIAENVAAPIVAQLREEEMARYGLAAPAAASNAVAYQVGASRSSRRAAPQRASAPSRANAGRGGGANRGGAYFEPGDRAMARRHNAPPAEVDYNAERVVRQTFSETPLDYDDGYEEEIAGVPEVDAADAMAGVPEVDDFNRVPDTANFSQGASLIDVKTGTVYPLNGYRVSLGRERNNNISIHDANISRSHAEIIYDNGFWIIRDLGSTNGTYLNDEPITESELYDGDVITLGMTDLEFQEG